jgi:hypothetical protein
MEPTPTTSKPRLFLLILFLWFLEYGMVWYTVSQYFFQGCRGWSQFQRQQNLVIFTYTFSMVPEVWYGLVHGLLLLLPRVWGMEPMPTTAKLRLLSLFLFPEYPGVWFGLVYTVRIHTILFLVYWSAE